MEGHIIIEYLHLNMDIFLKTKNNEPKDLQLSSNTSLSQSQVNYVQMQTIDAKPSVPDKKINMNDILVKKVTEGPDPSYLDKKIEMRYVKDGKAYRTFVFNLEHFIKGKKELDEIVHGIKKTFGTSCAYKETEFGVGYGFAGDCSTKIKRYLIDKKVVTSENFK